MKCSRCRHENEAGAKFCEECAAPLARACAKCGRQLSPTAKFCPACAHPAGSLAPPLAPRFGAPESYTPRHLAERILSSRAALEGERKRVTVLFADLKGSLELLADRDPEDARKILDPVLEIMMEAVHRYEGVVNQVMGDGIMALFGAPVAHEDHAVRACCAAIRMQDAVRRYADEVRRAQGASVEIRVGLNSGEVVVRAIRGDLHVDYSAVGPTVHLAARMEQLARGGTILLAPDTLRLADGYVNVRSLGPVPVKGLDEPIEVFELTGVSATRSRLHAAATRGLTPFVGRAREVDAVAQALERAARRQGQVVAVVGEAGVGKSRLYWEFTTSYRIRGCLVLVAGSASYGRATPYLPVAELLRQYFAIDDVDDARRVREKVTGKLLALDRALEPLLPPLLGLLDVAGGDEAWNALDAAQRRQRTVDALRRLLLRESQEQPLVLVFEDLHWIDSETQAFLDALVDGVAAARMLLLVNYRPEYTHAWGSRTHYMQIRIDPLPPETAEELLHSLLGIEAGLAPLKRMLIERTEGNPFYLEESVRMMAQTGVLQGTRGSFRLAGGAGHTQIPPTVHAILASRIDRLSAEDKSLLQVAAAIGRDVPLELLRRVADQADDDVRRALGRLQAAEFLRETGLFPDELYGFTHALTHEVAYGSLVADRRRALHRRVLEEFEALYADRLEANAERLAHHAVAGETWERAVHYLRESGTRAMARSANQEAIAFLEQALDALRKLPETPETLRDALDLLLLLGPALVSVQGSPAAEVEASYKHAHDLCRRLGDTSRLFPVLWGLWYSAYARGRYPTARERAEGLLAEAERAQDSGQLVEANHAMWATLSAMGEVAATLPYIERGLALYDRAAHGGQAFLYGGHDPGACCRYHLAVARCLLGFPDQALDPLHAAITLAAQLAHAQTMVLALCYGWIVQYHRGDYQTAVETAQTMCSLADDKGFTAYTGDAAVMVMRATLAATGAAEPLDATHDLFVRTRKARATWRDTIGTCLLADAYGATGYTDRGLEVLAALTDEQRGAFYAPEVHRIEGELRWRRGEMAEAEASYRRAAALADRRGERSLQLRAVLGLTRLLRESGRGGEARATLSEVQARFTEGFGTADLRAARALLDELSAT